MNDIKMSDSNINLTVFMALIFILFIGTLFESTYSCWRALTLRERGVSVDAPLVRIYSDIGTKSSSAVFAEIKFQVEDGRVIDESIPFASTESNEDPNYAYAVSKGTIPIVYDPINPKRISTNFNNSVFTRNPYKTGVLIFIICSSFLVIMSLIIAYGLKSYKLKVPT